MKSSGVGVLMLVLAGLSAHGAAPPAPPRNLTAREQKDLDALEARLVRHALAGKFDLAAEVAERMAAFRAQRQGARHWQAIEARLDAADWQRLAKVPEDARAAAFRARVLNNEGMSTLERGAHREAEKTLREALAIRREVLGEQAHDTAVSYNNLAYSLYLQRKPGEALVLYRRALAICRKVLGEQHSETAHGYNGAAACLDRQGKHGEALPLHQRALAVRRNVLGEEHPLTAVAYNNVAACLDRQGKPGEALPLHERALAIRRKVLGERDPETARSYSNVAGCLDGQGKHGEALPLHRSALAIRRKVLGERHPETATSYGNLAACLQQQGKPTEALALHQLALDIRLEVLGEEHPDTASSYYNMAYCVFSQGKPAEALPLYRRALAIRLKVLGEEHPLTAASQSGVASCLDSQGKHGEALALFRRALAIRLAVHGEQHPETATSYSNLAACLDNQGRYGEALPLYQRSLAISLKVHGEQHPDTARSYNNVAACLGAQGKYDESQHLLERALAICLQVHGEQHPHTAVARDNVAACLHRQGKYDEALPQHRRALAIRLAVLGKEHPDTATSCNNVAICLHEQGKPAEALPSYRRALAIRLKVHGEEHPAVAQSYNNLAGCLEALGKHGEIPPLYQRALAICLEVYGEQHPVSAIAYNNLAGCLEKQGLRPEALRLLQASLPDQESARFHTASTGFDRAFAAKEYRSPHAMLAAGLARMGQPRTAMHHAELALARGLLDDLATASDSDERARTAVMTAELNSLGDRLVPLLGLAALSEEQTALREQLVRRRRTLQADLARLASAVSARQVLPMERIQRCIAPDAALVSWIDDLGEHLGCVLRHEGPPVWVPLHGAGKAGAWTSEDESLPQRCYAALTGARAGMPLRDELYRQRLAPLEEHLKGVKHLLVVPTGALARVPVEALTNRWTISYVPSGSAFAGAAEQARKPRPSGALVLADPAFTSTPVRREEDRKLLAYNRGTQWTPLPGTRLEARALAGLLPSATLLLGSDASEQRLEELASSGKLKGIGLLHLATHGEASASRPLESALILAQDRLPQPREQERRVLAGKKPVEGKLSVATILRHWTLDAELVTLSACQTGLGTDAGGEGMLGFAQALLQKGARSVLLSRWKVDDNATALLMVRFYENLLGRREGLKAPLGKAESLREAKQWLRTLTREEAEKRLTKLVDGVPRGERGSISKPLPPRKLEVGKGDWPFAHPYYWAAFVLIGDPI
jgi:CHAT domain-containing protein/tetratricopeptide (TPR) repeat protein